MLGDAPAAPVGRSAAAYGGGPMASLIGKQAVVVGAGMGGLTAARALADNFEHVLVIRVSHTED